MEELAGIVREQEVCTIPVENPEAIRGGSG